VYVSREAKKELRTLAMRIRTLLDLAQHLATVVVVTNARRPWVENSRKKFLKKLSSEAFSGIPVIYAIEQMEQSAVVSPQLVGQLLTETKVRAMKSAVTTFYSKYPNQSWKNVISIGDAYFEHAAIRQVVKERPEYTMEKPCRTKTIKMLDSPSLPAVCTQLTLLTSWLAGICASDRDLDIVMDSAKETLDSWHSQFSHVGSDGRKASLASQNSSTEDRTPSNTEISRSESSMAASRHV